MAGRLTGSEGNLAAGEYISDRFNEYGLQPFDGASYFQPFLSPVTHNSVQPVLSIIVSGNPSAVHVRQAFDVHEDFVPTVFARLGSGDVTGQVVWMGRCKRSDFSPDLMGKIVLCAPLSNLEQRDTADVALDNQVGGLLIMREDDGPYPRSGYGYGQLIEMPAFTISPAVVEDLLSGTSYSLEDLLAMTLDPVLGPTIPAYLDVTVHMVSKFERELDVGARNVLGMLPGTDPSLSDEIIIVGAHYDHVGIDPDGTIYNGANDNASGVAVMLEIARLWSELGYQPPRRVLFAAWDAEEQGLVGSTFFVNWLAQIGIDRPLAYLNLDLVGVGDEVHIYGNSNGLNDQLQTIVHSSGNSKVYLDPRHLGDARPFGEGTGVPSSWLAMGVDSSYYPELHRPDDDVDIIRLENLETIGTIASEALYACSEDPAGCPDHTVTIKLAEGVAVQIAVGTPLQITIGWAADTNAHLEEALNALSMEASIDGGPMILLPGYHWSPGEESGGLYISHWFYQLGILDPGIHTLEVVGTLSQPVTDGFDLDIDGQPDIYSGQIWDITMQIEVY
jgi:hypothetical protein